MSQTINCIKHCYLFDGNGNVRILTDIEGVVSEVGDYVYASAPDTGGSDYKEILNAFIRQSNNIIIIHVFVNGEVIETTPTYPFWIEDEWVPAKVNIYDFNLT